MAVGSPEPAPPAAGGTGNTAGGTGNTAGGIGNSVGPGSAGAPDAAAGGEDPAGGPAAPRPNRVRYNDWRQVPVEPLSRFVPRLPVSVIVLYYRNPMDEVERMLATLEGQTYPRELFEVVVVDDGSDPPFEPPGATPFPLRAVRQERRGIGFARGRNRGAAAAAHDILLYLDGDMLVEAWWIAAHARWHHLLSDVVTVGRYEDVPTAGLDADGLDAEAIRNRPGTVAELLADRPRHPRSGAEHLLRTRDLTSRADDPFRALLGGNYGVRRDFYRSVGGHDESFLRYGMEEIEFGYRAHTRGALFAPVPEAFALHQGTAGPAERRWHEQHVRYNRAKCAHRIAHRGIRGSQPGRIFSVPELVVTVAAGGAAPSAGAAGASGDSPDGRLDRLLEAVATILADRRRDLVVRLEVPADGEQLEEWTAWLREVFGPDPRVVFAAQPSALDDFPASPFHLTIPPAMWERGFRKDLVHRLFGRLGDAVTVAASLEDGAGVSLTRAWALWRARRAGGTAADYGDTRKIPVSVLKLRSAREAARLPDPASPPGFPGRAARLLDRARAIRGAADFRSFLAWSGAVAARRISERIGRSRPAGLPDGRHRPGGPEADPSA